MNQLTKNSSQEELKNYFAGVLALSKSEDPFPVDLDDVWMLAYTQKGHAVRDLKELGIFFEGEDYISGKDKETIFAKNGQNKSEDFISNTFVKNKTEEVFSKNGKNLPESETTEEKDLGGRPVEKYYISTSCLEYLIARKVRPVFEVYRKVLHFALNRDEGFLLAATAKTYYSLNVHSSASDIARYIGDMYNEQQQGNRYPIFLTEVFSIAFPTLSAAVDELTRQDNLTSIHEGIHFIRSMEDGRQGYFLTFEGFNQLIACRKAIVANAYKIAVKRGDYPELPFFIKNRYNPDKNKISKRTLKLMGITGDKQEQADDLRNRAHALANAAESKDELEICSRILDATLEYIHFIGDAE